MDQQSQESRRLRLLEKIIRGRSVRSKIDSEGLHELSIISDRVSPRERVARDDLREWWLVRYVLKHHRRLGFSAVKGPFETGPDLRVKHGPKWSMAEVEIGWRNYIRHKHHLNERFDDCRFLIVLADARPPTNSIRYLPPKVIYIDRAHFTNWFEIACAQYARMHQPSSQLHARLHVISAAMKSHWDEICPDRDRSMAVCPDCDSCPYFGEGSFNEATPAFTSLAAIFAEKHCKRRTKDAGNRWNLERIDKARLNEFLEQHLPS
jgi:hypothetical protein